MLSFRQVKKLSFLNANSICLKLSSSLVIAETHCLVQPCNSPARGSLFFVSYFWPLPQPHIVLQLQVYQCLYF
jgi:hypothetical protein